MISFDSNILIYALEGNKYFGEQARKVLLAASHGSCVSVIILSELLCKYPNTSQDYHNVHDALLSLKGVKYLPVNTTVALEAANIILKSSIAVKLPDALHLATAKCAGAKEFWTNDHQLTKVSVPGLKVRTLSDLTS